MPTILVKFQLPFRLALASDSAFVMRLADREVTIVVFPGTATRRTTYRELPPETAGSARIWYRSVHQPSGTSVREYRFIEGADPFVEEVSEQLGFTTVHVLFATDTLPAPTNGSHLVPLRDEALEYLRTFIGTYVGVAPDADVFLPSAADTAGTELYIAEESRGTGDDLEWAFRFGGREFQPTHSGAAGVTKSDLSPLDLHDFERALQDPKSPDLALQLLVEARALSVVHGNPRLAVVIAQSGFEVFLQDRLRRACQSRGVITLPIGRGSGRAQKPVDEALADATLRGDLLGAYCSMFTSHGVQDGAPYQRWLTDAYEPRNQIVHAGRTNVTREEAKSALTAILEFVNYIDVELEKTAPKGN